MLLARALIKKGLSEDVTALKEIGDRIDGKASQSVDITSKGKQIGAAAAIAEVESKLKQ